MDDDEKSTSHIFSGKIRYLWGALFTLLALLACSISIKSTIKLTKIINNSSLLLLSFRNNDIITELTREDYRETKPKTGGHQSSHLSTKRAFEKSGVEIRGGQVVGGCGQQLERNVHERRPGDSYDYSGSERENRREDGVRGFGIAISVFLVRRGEANQRDEQKRLRSSLRLLVGRIEKRG